jgi:coenzyme PQQ precursor peptide PqqA
VRSFIGNGILAAPHGFATHENHEERIMKIRFPRRRPLARMSPAGPPGPAFTQRPEELEMKWETPQAIDLRFGMEITMYIAHR